MPVGGSRHYGGPGLGEIGLWGCPSCGEDNTGPMSQGCVHCGAGKPGTRPPAAAAAPPPSPPPAADDDVERGDIGEIWAEMHPEATVADAYRAGYEAAQQDAMRRAQPVPVAASEFSADRNQRIGRTMLAALSLFREQVLLSGPEEIVSGEWSSVVEIDQVITELQQSTEVPHA